MTNYKGQARTQYRTFQTATMTGKWKLLQCISVYIEPNIAYIILLRKSVDHIFERNSPLYNSKLYINYHTAVQLERKEYTMLNIYLYFQVFRTMGHNVK